MKLRRSWILWMVALSAYAEDNTLKEVFSQIYETAYWGKNEENVGFSGTGSLVEQAEPYMKFLQEFLQEKNVQSVVDIGCGDWTFSQHIPWGSIRYFGVDVVPSVVRRDQEKFSSPITAFYCGDALSCPLPPADLLLCKDVLQHLSNEDVEKFLKRIEKKFKHCLITNDVDIVTLTSKNPQIDLTKRYRPLDLTKPPFCVKGIKIFTYRSGTEIKQVLYLSRYTEVD